MNIFGNNEKSAVRRNIFLVLILVIAGINYSIGYYWGLTSVFQPDESKLVEPLRQMVETKTILHDTWAYPASASSKILAVALVFVNKFITIEQIEYYYYNRLFCALLAVGSVYLTWLIVRRVKDDTYAMLMAFIMAVFPTWAQYSKQVSGDIPALFFSLLVLLMSQNYINTKKRSYLIAMSFFASCSSLEKWHGAWTCFYIAIILLLCHKKDLVRFIQEGFIAAASFLAGIVLVAPNIITDFNGLVSGIGFTYVYDGTIENPLITAYPDYFFMHAGILSVIAVLIGIYVVFFKEAKEKSLEYYAVFLFSPACLFAFWFIMTRTTFDRWGCGIYWGMLLLMLEGLSFVIKTGSRNVRIAGVVALMAILLCFISESVLINLLATNTQKDGRIVGEALLKELGVNVDNSLSDYYTTLAPGGMRVEGDSLAIEFQDYGEEFAVEIDGKPYLREPDIKYVVVGGFNEYHKDRGGYPVVKKYGKQVGEISSKMPTCVFWRQTACGKWYWLELDTFRKNINDIRTVINSDVIGPYYTVYDVSDFGYLE